MIQFILMLLGLAFPNNNDNTVTTQDGGQIPPITLNAGIVPTPDPGDTGGETLPILPPKK
ncbi:hypothetical protein [Chryseobacterium pennipullorum]|nr:hypothetical protein [Chryseobacterium pennipullorum]